MRRLLLALVAGCALTSKSAPVEVRYFTPETTSAVVTSTPHAATTKVRMGRITSSAYLRTRIVYRWSDHELGAYDDLRWTEEPEAYLRRSLAAALFEARPLAQTMAGRAPTLDVELVSFEEVRHGPQRAARVEVTYVLHDGDDVLASGRLAEERPARTGEMNDVVAALAVALDAATARIGDAVVTRLAR